MSGLITGTNRSDWAMVSLYIRQSPFDLADRDAAIGSLTDRDDIVNHGDGSYVWLEPAGNFQRSVGTIIIEGKRIVFETTSQKRAEKARDELPSLLGGAARFRAIS
jgi:hypothetical protein